MTPSRFKPLGAGGRQPGSYQLAGRISTSKRACVYRHSFTWTKSRLFVDVTLRNGSRGFYERLPPELSSEFPAQHLAERRKLT